VNVTGWSRGLEVTGGGQGVVSHAGLALLRYLADKTGLTGGLSAALATPRILIHDRGRVVADPACAIADGAWVISDFPGDVRSGRAVRAGSVGADGVADAGQDRPRREQGGQAHHRGGEYGAAARLGAGRGPARGAARGPAGGQEAGRRGLHPLGPPGPSCPPGPGRKDRVANTILPYPYSPANSRSKPYAKFWRGTRCYSQHSPSARSSSPGYSVSFASRAEMIRPVSALVRG
jgi:hypothetical protein